MPPLRIVSSLRGLHAFRPLSSPAITMTANLESITQGPSRSSMPVTADAMLSSCVGIEEGGRVPCRSIL
jgi:hypothetical protein